MKSMVRRLMLSAAFVAGLAAPLAATWSTPAQAFSACSLLSGRDQWTHTYATGGSFTVNVAHDTGVTVTGTPPPLTSLPLVLTSTSGHLLTISASGTQRVYQGSFTTETQESCSCPNTQCPNYDGPPECPYLFNAFCDTSDGTCTTTTCGPGGSGSCAGGICTASSDFTAKF